MSFYPNKHITTGEGGMVLTDDPQLHERVVRDEIVPVRINTFSASEGMGGMLVATPLAYMVTALGAISAMSPNFAQLQKKQRALEGSYRSVQSRLQDSAESVALYGGEEYGGGIPNYIIDKARPYCSRWEDQIKKATFLRQFMGVQLVADDMERDPSYWR